MTKTINFLFGFKDTVNRREYFTYGVLLMLLKYLGEVGLYYLAAERILLPLNFLLPLYYQRYPVPSPIVTGVHVGLPDWFGPTVILWSLPFIWIGVSMTVRRAANAGRSPWWGILFFAPGLNLILMAVLSVLPMRDNTWGLENHIDNADKFKWSKIIFAQSFVFAMLGVVFVWYSANLVKNYGASLFLVAPFLLGLVQSFWIGKTSGGSFKKSFLVVLLTILLLHLFLLLFALEGAICIAMSLPICLPMAALGAFGAGIACYGSNTTRLTPTLIMLVAIPSLPVLEKQSGFQHEDMVLSTTIVDATPEMVWKNVVQFSDLPPTNDWLFKLGVAHPLRARIEGSGVGAVRHCEFSTGAFVEPITVWDEPQRLAFDVKYQPQPMTELSFYDRVDAPHLHGYFQSQRGEFRLIPLADGRTRLEGRTWYKTAILPGWYWQIYGRWFIHKIHGRVLQHIKNLSETKS